MAFELHRNWELKKTRGEEDLNLPLVNPRDFDRREEAVFRFC